MRRYRLNLADVLIYSIPVVAVVLAAAGRLLGLG